LVKGDKAKRGEDDEIPRLRFDGMQDAIAVDREMVGAVDVDEILAFHKTDCKLINIRHRLKKYRDQSSRFSRIEIANAMN